MEAEKRFSFVVCERSGADPPSCGLAACDNGCPTIEVEVVHASDYDKVEAELSLLRVSFNSAIERIRIAEAERSRLREALERFINRIVEAERSEFGDDYEAEIAFALAEARQALNPTPTPEDTCPSCGQSAIGGFCPDTWHRPSQESR